MKKIAIILFLSISMFYLGQGDKIFAESPKSLQDWINSEPVKTYMDETGKLMDLSGVVADSLNKMLQEEIIDQESVKDMTDKIDYCNKRMEEIKPPEELKSYHTKLKSCFESQKLAVQNINNPTLIVKMSLRSALEINDARGEWKRVTAEKGASKKGN
jgi:hypothetical protein